MIAYMNTNKRFQSTVKEGGRKLRQKSEHISCIYCKALFSCAKSIRLNSTHYLIMKIHNNRELQNIAIYHSADINYKDFMKI